MMMKATLQSLLQQLPCSELTELFQEIDVLEKYYLDSLEALQVPPHAHELKVAREKVAQRMKDRRIILQRKAACTAIRYREKTK